MRNVKVMIIKTICWSAWQQQRNKLQASIEEKNTLIQKKWTNKIKDEEKYTKNVITKNFVT
jgi:hypothetical protein